jgi:hypothetical protein
MLRWSPRVEFHRHSPPRRGRLMDGVRVVDLGVLVADEEGLEEVVQGIGEVRTHLTSLLSSTTDLYYYRPQRPRPLRILQLRSLVRLVHPQRLAFKALDRMVGHIRLPSY